MRERYLVKSFGDNQEGTKVGIVKMVELLKVHKTAMIVVPQIGKVNGTMLTDVLGPELSKLLLRDRQLTLPDDRSIGICAQSQVRNYRGNDVYLDLWGSKDSIAELEQVHGAKALILVTWLPKDCEKWCAEYQVSVIYDDKKSA